MPGAALQIATFPKCGEGQSALGRGRNYGKSNRILLIARGRHRAIIRDVSVAAARRKVELEMSHFFHPGSRLAGRHARRSGDWFHPLGRAAGREQRREGRRLSHLLNAKGLGRDPEAGWSPRHREKAKSAT